jgi:hypothetical protein
MLESGQRDVEAEGFEAPLHGQFAVPARAHPNLEESRRRFFQQAPARHQKATDIVIGIQRAESWLLLEVIRVRDGVEKSHRILRSLPSPSHPFYSSAGEEGSACGFSLQTAANQNSSPNQTGNQHNKNQQPAPMLQGMTEHADQATPILAGDERDGRISSGAT